jgi:DNA primase
VFKIRFNDYERNEIFTKSQQCLWMNDGKPGLEYLTKERCLSEKVIRNFCLGYIPKNVEHQLRDRIIIPIHDASGNLIALSSRCISDDVGACESKYWHESYEKSFYLYGVMQSLVGMNRWKFAIVSEGQIDVMQLHSHGVDNVVALCGNKMTSVHLSVIYRVCEDVVILLDHDAEDKRAGQIGAEKIKTKFDSAFNEYKRTKPAGKGYGLTGFDSRHHIIVAHLQEEGDPDEYVRKHGIESLKNIVREKLKELRHRVD